MAIDEKRRQKKLARKATKRRAVLAKRKASSQAGNLLAHGGQITVAASSPIYECLIPNVLFDMGIGNIVISRKMPNGNIGAGFSLVDIYCLGVKNCFFTVLTQREYNDKVGSLRQSEGLERWDPSCAVKLIEDAVSFARDLGFNPHRDYQMAKKIFGHIDPDECPREFEFGKHGKPYYVSGPNETRADSARIMDTLNRRFGPDGFHYMVAMEVKDE